MLIELITDSKALFERCKRENVSAFYEWPKWIAKNLEKELRDKLAKKEQALYKM
jgi:hypothetical protein